MTTIIDCIAIKRDGGALTALHWQLLVQAIVDGSMSDAQVGALAMAIRCQHLQPDEQAALTREMARQGETFNWRTLGIDGPLLDKHSSGGIGDKVSLILAPVLAACGAFVPMISGRGLGHTGGTLDKLDAIPGYQTSSTRDAIAHSLRTAGCAIVGQTDHLVPADKRLYAIRDQTATIDEQGLIVASILAKKIAAGLDALILDVKTGNGAFMQTRAQAQALAAALTAVGNEAGLRCEALISDMNQVLGDNAGNAVEVSEAVACLTGQKCDPRLNELVVHLAGRLLQLGGLAESQATAESAVRNALDTGAAAERFERMVHALGGPTDFLDNAEKHLPLAPIIRPVPALAPGVIAQIDVRAVGREIIALGGGRQFADQPLDYRVGFTDIAGLGVQIEQHQPLALVHAATEDSAQQAVIALQNAFVLSSEPSAIPPLFSTT